MVLESLFNPFSLKRKPWQMLVAGVIYTFVGLMLSYFVFRETSSILMIFLIVIATIPLLYITIQREEELDLRYGSESRLLKEHGKVLIFLIFLFFGITAAFVVSYIFFPEKIVHTTFSLQERAILNVNDNIRGALTGGMTHFQIFTKIIINNLKVLFFCLVFSLLYGTGAIFILTWNASVIATAMGSVIKTELAQVASLSGISSLAAYFGATTFGVFRYMTHGIFEIASYFVVGLAGGIISIAIVRKNINDEKILIDCLDLVFISLGLLLVAAAVEVYVTPLIFT